MTGTDQPVEGRTALVTGAGSGIGRGIALALGRAGYRVAVNYHDTPEGADETVAAVREAGADAFAVHADVRRAGEVQGMIAAVVDRTGALDLLVNNAGVQTWTAFLDVTEEEWDLVIDTNLKGCFLCTQAAARQMRDQGRGAIVNIGSGSNKVAFPRLVAYTASKGGIEMLTKVAAVELGPLGIRVNCVAPGAIDIERTRLEDPNYAETWGRLAPLQRVGLPTDVAGAVVFLASDQASFVSGQTLWVDGALFSQPPWVYRK
jgi:NAD(P)-dependent dehydrogenase (short-subunit alcohol dehydrogenase family)